ncbi:MAG: hypothetical protein WED09_05340 [Homoserinimonas sp.]
MNVLFYIEAMTAKKITRKLREELVKESSRQLKIQWKIGPMEGQRGCCRDGQGNKTGVAAEEDDAGNFTKFACKKPACRPGDPFGCSMTKARHERDKFSFIIKEWMKGGGHAYLVLFELRGKKDLRLSGAIDKSLDAIREPFLGKTWTTRKQKHGIVGVAKNLQVTRSKSGRWIVRRWAILTSTRELDGREIDALDSYFSAKWSKAIAVSGRISRGRVTGLQRIFDKEIEATAQFITSSYSPLPIDAPLEPYATSLTIQSNIRSEKEITPAELAAQYRDNGGPLESQFSKFDRNYYLVRSKGRYELRSEYAADRRYPLDVPEKCADFMDYALGMHDQYTFMAGSVKPTTESKTRWNQIIEGIEKVPWHDPYEGWRSRTPKLGVSSSGKK